MACVEQAWGTRLRIARQSEPQAKAHDSVLRLFRRFVTRTYT